MSEFARPYRLDMLGSAPLAVTVAANADEQAALAVRFGLLALDRLEARAELVRHGDEVRATGTVEGTATQACVATGADLPVTVAAPFALRFVPDGGAEASEIELDEAALDTIPYAGAAIDLGEAAAQTFALALDPWPRSAGADAALRAAGVRQEGEDTDTGPFARLKGLLDR